MDIILIGYGRMGKMVDVAAKERGHRIIRIIDNEEDWTMKPLQAADADVAIDFSLPQTAVRNFLRCIDAGLPLVTGTTGWQAYLDVVRDAVERSGTAFLYASNFNIGVNLFFHINRMLAELTDQHKEYSPSVTEIHHILKIDKPSGTAVSLAEDIIAGRDDISSWALDSPTAGAQLGISSVREGDVKGIHEIEYKGPWDTITLRHEAHDRMGFAQGAIHAAEWLHGRNGFFEFRDVLFDRSSKSST